MHPKSLGCTRSFFCIETCESLRHSRTDKAVLAVNGFAADGNMFVKKVKQRLEARQALADHTRD